MIKLWLKKLIREVMHEDMLEQNMRVYAEHDRLVTMDLYRLHEGKYTHLEDGRECYKLDGKWYLNTKSYTRYECDRDHPPIVLESFK